MSSTSNHRTASSASLAVAETDLPTDLLIALGYRPEDDAWDSGGRRTYLHEDDSTRDFINAARSIFGHQGWRRDKHALRTFRHEATGQMIEIEPGGADCTIHYLHHMKAAVTPC